MQVFPIFLGMKLSVYPTLVLVVTEGVSVSSELNRASVLHI